MTLVQPDPEMQILIRKELNEDVNTRDRDLEHMKDWLLKQPHLPDTWGKKLIFTLDNNIISPYIAKNYPHCTIRH